MKNETELYILTVLWSVDENNAKSESGPIGPYTSRHDAEVGKRRLTAHFKASNTPFHSVRRHFVEKESSALEW